MKEYDILILAAGFGKRMNSDIPKPVFPILNKPMLIYILETINKLPNPPVITYILTNNHHNEIIRDTCKKYMNCCNNIVWLTQSTEPMGTGHSVQIAIEHINPKCIQKPLIILSADVPMISTQTINSLVEQYYSSKINKAIILAVQNNNPFGYGRIITHSNSKFIKIVEEKDSTKEEKLITLVNTGIYCISYRLLCDYLSKINNNNASSEYYLTDLFCILKNENKEVFVKTLEDNKAYEVFNVNTIGQLKELEDLISNITI